jgi:hypothetical protein
VRFLAASQMPDGRWIDYRLPVGSSDGWVTAYVSLAMAQAAKATSVRTAADAALRGATWLAHSRSYALGWGFNSQTGPDADSTAWALRALAVTGMAIDPADVDFLLGHWTPPGGVATYRSGPAHWGDPHPDVTPVALLALPAGPAQIVMDRTLRFVGASREPGGAWPAYWWSTTHYSTLLNVELLASFGRLVGDEGPVVTAVPTQRVTSAVDLACVLHAATLVWDPEAIQGLAATLIRLQKPSGAWPPSRVLRVTDPEWSVASRVSPRGVLYADLGGVYTTATAVRALATWRD